MIKGLSHKDNRIKNQGHCKNSASFLFLTKNHIFHILIKRVVVFKRYMNDKRVMSSLAVGEVGVVAAVLAEGSIRRRFTELGMLPGAVVVCIGVSPLGDPSAYLIRDKIIAIRHKDAAGVMIN